MPPSASKDSELKCSLSEAYLKVISSVTHFPCTITDRKHDLLKIDAQFAIQHDFGPDAKKNVFTLYVQLKATSTALKWKNGKCRFKIEIDLYNDFRTIKTTEPMYLVVLILPKKYESRKWLISTHEQLSIKGCAYWVSLYGAPEVGNSSDVTITILKKNKVSADSLDRIVRAFANTGDMVMYEP